MNFYTILYAIKNIQDTLRRAEIVEANVNDDSGMQNFAYAYGRYLGTIKGMSGSVEVLNEHLGELQNLQQVASMFRLDDPAVLKRILALDVTDQSLLKDAIGEVLEAYKLGANPEDEEKD